MPRINPYTDAVEQEVTQRRSFDDPKQPGKPLELLMLRPDDAMTHLVIDDRAADNVAEYLGHPEKIPPVQGQRVRVTRGLCRAIAILQVLQAPRRRRTPLRLRRVGRHVPHPDRVDGRRHGLGHVAAEGRGRRPKKRIAGLRGSLVRAAMAAGQEHPEITARRDAVALAQYRLDRRRFRLQYPAEAEPPDFSDLTRAYLLDLALLDAPKVGAEDDGDGTGGDDDA